MKASLRRKNFSLPTIRRVWLVRVVLATLLSYNVLLHTHNIRQWTFMGFKQDDDDIRRAAISNSSALGDAANLVWSAFRGRETTPLGQQKNGTLQEVYQERPVGGGLGEGEEDPPQGKVLGANVGMSIGDDMHIGDETADGKEGENGEVVSSRLRGVAGSRPFTPPEGEQTLPVRVEGVPLAEQTLPGGEKVLLVEAQTLPVEEQKLPVEVQTLPIEGRTLPVAEQTLPVEEQSGDPLSRLLTPEDDVDLRRITRELAREAELGREKMADLGRAARIRESVESKHPGNFWESMSEADVADPVRRRAWLQQMIDGQLAPFEKGSFSYADVAAQRDRFEMSTHFIIEPGNITLIKDPDELSDNWSYWFRADQVEQLFRILSDRRLIPDHVEIVVNIQASPRLLRSEEFTDRPPLLSYCSTPEHFDLVGVGYQYHRCLMSEAHNDTEMCKLAWSADGVRNENPWEGRNDVALWRGSPTGGFYDLYDWKEKTRSRLAFLSKAHPEVLDAKFTTCSEGQCSPEAEAAIGEELGYADRLANFSDYVRHKYLVDIDGESWSSRFFSLLASGATVFKQATSYREFSDFFFTPGTHYVQYASDLGDLIGLLEGAEGRREELRSMADRSLTLVERLVEDEVIIEYMGMLLTSYAELFAPGEDAPGNDVPGGFEPAKDAPANDAPGDVAPGDFAPPNDAPGDVAPGDFEPANDGPGDVGPATDARGEVAPGDDAQGDATGR